jgi:endonuclease-3
MTRATATQIPLPELTVRVLSRLRRAIRAYELPAVEKISEEDSGTPFRVLVATMLSAQTKDAVTDAASGRLFRVADTPHALARLREDRIARLIYPVSFYRVKAHHVKETSRLLVERHGGVVPDTMEALMALPGVGRKTANLVQIVAHRRPGHICVDTHVHRIANRLGWVRTRTPEQTEHALYDVVPRRWWMKVNLYLVTWGQRVCRPVYPLCGACDIQPFCPQVGVTRTGRVPSASRPRAGG